MNLNENLPARGRNNGRGRSIKVVAVQAPLGPPLKPAPRRKSTPCRSDSSRIKWRNTTSSAGNSALHTGGSTSTRVSSNESRIIMALSEGRGDAMCEVGIAAINVDCPSLVLCQISDSQSYVNTLTKINVLNPTEILIPSTFVESFTTNRLLQKVKEHFTHIKITGVHRKSFNKNTGLQYIRQLCIPNMNSVLLVVQHRYYALAAAGGLLTYAEVTLYVMYAKESVKIEYQESEGCAIIDVVTADKLELVASTRPSVSKKYSCLLDILNYTQTKVGALALRASILQPPCKVIDIEARLNCVTELIGHGEMLTALQVSLQKVKCVDQLLSLANVLPDQSNNYSERQLNYLLLLNSILEEIPRLKEIFVNTKQPFFVDLCNLLKDPTFAQIKQLIRTVINTDAHPAKGKYGIMQRCFAIKSGLNNLLDLIRTSYSERLDELRDYVTGLKEKYGLSLSLNNNTKKGYHIILQLNAHQQKSLHKSDLPGEFIQVERQARSYTLKTDRLISLSNRIEDINLEILKMSNMMIGKLLISVRKHVGLFYTLCENLAKVDMLQSLAQASTAMQYVRPNFDDYLEILYGQHPLLNFLLPIEPVANSITASNDYNMHIITGPNGSGKSILIRQIVLLQIMAQVGCYVPAKSATFRAADRILARIYFDDNMACGASTFVLEMKEIQYFLTVMTKNSLVIADELCRSTALGEGTALAMAICEQLSKTPAFVFFTTHFKLLAKLRDLYMNVKVWQLETLTEMVNGQMSLIFTYNLIQNPTSLENYGMFLAKAAWPENAIKYAEEILKRLSQQAPQSPRVSSSIQAVHPARRLKYDLEANLKLLQKKGELKEQIDGRLSAFGDDLEKINCRLDFVEPEQPVLEDVDGIEPDLSRDISLMIQMETCNQSPGPFPSLFGANKNLSFTEMLVPDVVLECADDEVVNFGDDNLMRRSLSFANDSCRSINELNFTLNLQQNTGRTSTPLFSNQIVEPMAHEASYHSVLSAEDYRQERDLVKGTTPQPASSDSLLWKVSRKPNTSFRSHCTQDLTNESESEGEDVLMILPESQMSELIVDRNKSQMENSLIPHIETTSVEPSKRSSNTIMWQISAKNAVVPPSQSIDEEMEEITKELERCRDAFLNATPISQSVKPSPPSKTSNSFERIESGSKNGSSSSVMWQIGAKNAVSLQSQNKDMDLVFLNASPSSKTAKGNAPKSAERAPSVPSKESSDTIMWTMNRKDTVSLTSQSSDKVVEEISSPQSPKNDPIDDKPKSGVADGLTFKTPTRSGIEILAINSEQMQSPEVNEITKELESCSQAFFEADEWAKEKISQSQASSMNHSHIGCGGFQITVAADVHGAPNFPSLSAKPVEADIQQSSAQNDSSRDHSHVGCGGFQIRVAADVHAAQNFTSLSAKPMEDMQQSSTVAWELDQAQNDNSRDHSHISGGGFQISVTADVHPASQPQSPNAKPMEADVQSSVKELTQSHSKNDRSPIACGGLQIAAAPSLKVVDNQQADEIARKLDQSQVPDSENVNKGSSIFLQETQPINAILETNDAPKLNTSLEPLGDIHLELFSDVSQEANETIYKSFRASPDLFSTPQPSPKKICILAPKETPQLNQASSLPTIAPKKKKWNPPYKTQSAVSPLNKRKPGNFALVQPKKLTKKEIVQSFYEQDKELLARNDASFAEYILNRPNVKQIQEMEYIASFRRTDEGVLVMPFASRETKRRTKRKFVTPLLRQPSADFDWQMFSDKNAGKFEEYMNFKKPSPFLRGEQTPFQLCAGETVRRDDSQSSKTGDDLMCNFGRNMQRFKSDFLKKLQESVANNSQPPSQLENSAPGFYTQNKERLDSITNKYLNSCTGGGLGDVPSLPSDIAMESFDSCFVFSQFSSKLD
ncbi:hypothetical protein PPYR_13401 [Photinus pyralis]|uniref:DNA mismatch repair proteins mutS family domain-containing protein n=1 Tax=Photinus pyralis TaxID=7054 RepID=A0A5N4A8X8_PHOPY|nr:uncharacterized protein LOC116177738 [Photinus pyralis]XP_031352667.1 uncharacterized protein LOC116177738 [Photinus pyralis]KAB0793781.1 hypothetical protein PPYR_13401 [Photinus pyralis]